MSMRQIGTFGALRGRLPENLADLRCRVGDGLKLSPSLPQRPTPPNRLPHNGPLVARLETFLDSPPRQVAPASRGCTKGRVGIFRVQSLTSRIDRVPHEIPAHVRSMSPGHREALTDSGTFRMLLLAVRCKDGAPDEGPVVGSALLPPAVRADVDVDVIWTDELGVDPACLQRNLDR